MRSLGGPNSQCTCRISTRRIKGARATPCAGGLSGARARGSFSFPHSGRTSLRASPPHSSARRPPPRPPCRCQRTPSSRRSGPPRVPPALPRRRRAASLPACRASRGQAGLAAQSPPRRRPGRGSPVLPSDQVCAVHTHAHTPRAPPRALRVVRKQFSCRWFFPSGVRTSQISMVQAYSLCGAAQAARAAAARAMARPAPMEVSLNIGGLAAAAAARGQQRPRGGGGSAAVRLARALAAVAPGQAAAGADEVWGVVDEGAAGAGRDGDV